MKTRLLFIPDEQTLLLLESELPADRLVNAVNAGGWSPPPPYDRVQGVKDGSAGDECRLQAVCLGNQVVVYAVVAETEGRQQLGLEEAPQLTRRQQQVLMGLAKGLTSNQMALQLDITPRTVSRYVADIKQLLQACTRAQVVSRAAALGLLPPQE